MTAWSLFCRTLGLTRLFRSSELFNPEGYGSWKRDSVRHVDIVTGCLFLIRRDLWLRLGGFAEEFFMYGEEADLCLRARGFGARPMITPAATIVHYGGGSSTDTAEKVIYQMRAKIELVKRHWPRYLHGLGSVLLLSLAKSRLIAARKLAFFRRRTEEPRSATPWQEVWDKRVAWLEGYPPPKSADRKAEIIDRLRS